jgi:alpha-L-arabinofuranosidase
MENVVRGRVLKLACVGVYLAICWVALSSSSLADEPTNTLIINTDGGEYQISRHIYGQFAEHLGRCIYGGLWVGKDSATANTAGVRTDVIDALKELHIPNLRWPGGCFADNYHWRDGIGPPDKRPERVNIWWGNVPETNAFGTHEFLSLCEKLGCEPVICGNVGSGSPKELARWDEYVNAARGALAEERKANGQAEPWHVHFWGLGNESWGCGGNMRPEYYANLMLRFATFVRPYNGTQPFLIAGGANTADYQWTEVQMQAYQAKPVFQGLSLHYYTTPTGVWEHKGPATDFAEDQWASTLKRTLYMRELVEKHGAIMDRYDPEAKVSLCVDEWGTWYDPPEGADPAFLYQQNTMRDAVVAGINLNIFNNHCRRVRMANIAQTVNVLQAMVLTRGDQMVLTPTYYVFKMYRPHQDATMLPVELNSPEYAHGDSSLPAVTASASRDKSGAIHISLTNANPNQPVTLACQLAGEKKTSSDAWRISGKVLTAARMDQFNDFGKSPAVMPEPFGGAHLQGKDELSIELPPKSVVMLELRGVTP